MKDHLQRWRAPISETAWQALERDARSRLRTHLTARQVVDFSGPHGWQHSATELGRVVPLAEPVPIVTACQRRVLPLVELRCQFAVGREEVEAVDRGAPNPDFRGVEVAARALARAENFIVFHGFDEAGIAGMSQCSSHEPVPLPDDTEEVPRTVARALNMLRDAGIEGPFALVAPPDQYARVIEATEHGGYSLLEHVKQIIGGPVLRALGINEAFLCSIAGGHFIFESGQDVSIGYLDHTEEAVQLYLEESFAFVVVEPEAAVRLRGTP